MEEKIVYAYSVQMLSIAKISNLFHVSVYTVEKILKAHHVQIRNLSDSHKLPVNSAFFEIIDTEQKAYWLGFMYADGYVTKNVMGIKLKDDDSEHLEKFKQALNSSHKVGHYIGQWGFDENARNNYCSLTIEDQKLVHDLINCGVVYNKSKVLSFPQQSIVSTHLVHHFIRGYFDGDGSVYRHRSALGVSFNGTKEFLTPLLDILKDVTGTHSAIYSDHSIYCIKIGGRNIIQKLFNFMYTDATVFLGRKKQRFDQYLA